MEYTEKAVKMGFDKMMNMDDFKGLDMPAGKADSIKLIATMVFDQIVDKNMSIKSDVKQNELIKGILDDTIASSLSKKELEQVHNLCYYTLSEAMNYAVENYK